MCNAMPAALAFDQLSSMRVVSGAAGPAFDLLLLRAATFFCTMPTCLRTLLAVIHRMLRAFLGAGLADIGTGHAHGLRMRAIAGQLSGREAANRDWRGARIPGNFCL